MENKKKRKRNSEKSISTWRGRSAERRESERIPGREKIGFR